MVIESRDVVATWLVMDSVRTASYYPAAGGLPSSDSRVHRVYLNCVRIYFSIASRVLGDKYLPVLFTNSRATLALASPELMIELERLGVAIVEIPLAHETPANYYPAWANQFYILDILKDLKGLGGDRAYLILDSDCILARPLDGLFADVRRHRILTMDLKVPLGDNINGLTREEMGEIFAEMSGGALQGIPNYYGGEFFAATQEAIDAMADLAESAWTTSLQRARLGQKKFNEEAHLLSYAYHRMGIAAGTANAHIKRIWTGANFLNGKRGDERLAIWHLPAEKRIGYARLRKSVLDRGSWFWSDPVDERWRERLAKAMGVPRPSRARMLHELTSRGLERLFRHFPLSRSN